MVLWALLCLPVAYAFAQTSTTETFGQNRVQYKDFIFSYYESDNFTTYFYQGGQDIAKFVIKTAEDDIDEISKMLDVRNKGKIDIIVYNNINELNQTNIGIYNTPDPGLTLKIPEGKIMVYFNGDHRDLARQIREGIANILVNKTVRGNNFSQVVQNSILVSLPDWYRVGLVKYISEGWTTDMEDRLRDGILTGRFKKLNKLQPDDAIFVGQSIWHYIDEVHGQSALNNIVYLTRVNRSVDNGFLFVLGTNLSETLKNWYTYYTNRFTNEAKETSMPGDSTILKTKIKKGVDYYEPRISPDGKYVAYASNDMGRYRVHLLNTETHKTKVILRGGFKTNSIFTDESLPLIAWDPAGDRLAMIKDKRAEIELFLYDVKKDKRVMNPVRKFQKIVSFSFVDSKQLVLSATQNGQTDIYLYTIASTTYRKLTDDFYDDLNPAYVKLDSMRGILFSSNREDDTLRTKRYDSQRMQRQLDLYFYDLDANSNVLYRVTNTENADEIDPQPFSDSTFCFLSDSNGVRNRYIGRFETVFDHREKVYRFTSKETGEEDSVQVRMNVPLDTAIDRKENVFKDSSVLNVYRIAGVSRSYTNYTHSILDQNLAPAKGLALDMFRLNGKIQFRKYDVQSASAQGPAPTMDYVLQQQRMNSVPGANPAPKSAPAKEAPKNTTQYYDSLWATRGKHPYDFQSEFDYGIKLFDWDSVAAAHGQSSPLAENGGYVFRPSKVRPYFVRFMVDNVVMQLDNDPIITPYQTFNGSYYTTPLPAFGLKVGITDLLENYKIYGGIRIPFSDGALNLGYYLCVENLKKKLDKKFTFYRGSESNNIVYTDPVTGNQSNTSMADKTTLLEEMLKYPFDVLNSLRFTFAFRNDKYQLKAVDLPTLNYPDTTDNWLSFRAEYVFDNCMEVMPDIRYGTRFKVFAEVYKEFPTQSTQISDQVSLPKPIFNNRAMFNVGFDLRHYIKVYRQIIWANRFSGAASFGTAKMIYYLGGLDNWISTANKFDYSTPIDYNNNYAFQTVATPLRGFDQNARNGDKYLLINSELRVPIFAALSNAPIKSDFIRNLTLVAFFDAGTAWEGLSPFSTNNLFSEQIPNSTESPSVVVDLNQYKSPVIFGFGPGIRTTFLGFFVRVDVGWGYDTGYVNPKPKGYFSLDYDF